MKNTHFALMIAAILSSGLASADSTGLVGTTVTDKPRPPATDVTQIEVGKGYYSCAGHLRKDMTTGFDVLRKGVKTKCGPGPMTVTFSRISNKGKTTEYLDAVDLVVLKNTGINFECKGADVALSKITDTETFTTQLKAWNVVNNKLVPVTNLKCITCVNDGYGAD